MSQFLLRWYPRELQRKRLRSSFQGKVVVTQAQKLEAKHHWALVPFSMFQTGLSGLQSLLEQETGGKGLSASTLSIMITALVSQTGVQNPAQLLTSL